MQEVTKVITPAEDFSLISIYYARLGLNLVASADPTVEDQIEMFIRWASDEVAQTCNRVFARETVEETFLDLSEWENRIYLSHYPIAEITGVAANGAAMNEGSDYQIERGTGLLRRLGGVWASPVVVNYTGGYRLPYEAPESLQYAVTLMIREAYYATLRGDATVRMVAHKEARVIYFDPAQQARALMGGGGGASGGGSAARRASADLLKKFTRFWV
jgi:hypothetical protein